MVMFFEWHRIAMDPKSSSCLPMTGEDTGLGALASPLAGYLGKVQERAALLENCPWCTAKGFTYALRSYRINLQESITLCTNPQCLFPLVTRPLEDVMASLDPVEPTVGNKRKNTLPLEEEQELIKPALKRLRSSKLDDLGPQSVTDAPSSPAQHGAVNTVRNGQHAAPKTDGENVNGYDRVCPVAETTEWESLPDEDDVADKDPDSSAYADVLAPPTCSVSAGHSTEALLTAEGGKPVQSYGSSESDLRQGASPPDVLNSCGSLGFNQSSFTNEDTCSAGNNIPSTRHNEEATWTEQKSPTADVTSCKDAGGIRSESEDLSCASLTDSEELVSVPNQLFWRNSDNLCWLDSLLAALVNCKSLRKCKPKDEPQRSSVWHLMRGYEDICAAVQVHQRTDRDGVVRVPNHVLQKAEVDLQSLRMSAFKLLQPKLHCKLGQRETPVFAMPLLLTMDSWVERLFQSTFQWEFKCSECKVAMNERIVKTLPTFTNIVPDWRPLHAVHLAPCNVCHKKNQTRRMTLERVPPVFALHFVEGLPDNNVSIYAFNFNGKRYSITTVIQYNHRLQHFVTWICRPDGSWLEYDDLKHTDCKTHEKLQVPAQEMHVVFWEEEEDKEPRVCSPSSTCAESAPSENERIPSLSDKDFIADEGLSSTPDQCLHVPHNAIDIVCAQSLSEDGSSIMDTTVTADVDTSIGEATLLETFEGLTQNDIITLTLVEVTDHLEMQPVNDNQQDVDVHCRNEMLESTPDSSSRRGQGRGRGTGRSQTVSRQTSAKAALSEAAPHASPPVCSKPSNVISDKPEGPAAQDNKPPAEIPQQGSLVSSSDTLPPPTSQISPTKPVTADQSARWSFLLSRNPLQMATPKVTAIQTPTLVTQVKPSPPIRCFPKPVERQQVPAGLYTKPQLRTEESEGLPLKAAEMYGAFGAKSSNTQTPPPSTALLSGKLLPPITSPHLTNTTVISGTSLPMPGATGLPEISFSKKHGSQSSKVPLGLSQTEALRYKLLKKLKAKKKKLAKLNKLLGDQGGAGLRPDSTDVNSPSTVTSSTYDGSTYDDFLSDLLSPATTASNLSPDSTGFLEMLANGQDGADCVVGGAGAVSQVNGGMNGPNTEIVQDQFTPVAQRPTDMEAEALRALELFL